jgi:glutathione peroxidase
MSLYSLSTRSLAGKPFDLSQLSGKVTLVVNVASACGNTPQYAGLQALHDELSGQGFAVLGFPCNDFGRQEPGSSEEIASFCERSYGVGFPMFEKLVVKAGPQQSPIYAELSRASGKLPNWNFGKYLVGRDGEVLGYFEPKTPPNDPALRRAIETALAATG